MKALLLTFFVITNSVIAQELTNEDVLSISKFKKLFQNLNKEKIANNVIFPLSREYPIPPIESKEEFLIRFDEIFDSTFIQQIADSKLSKDWSNGGWRGIRFLWGALWLTPKGKLFMVNYQSPIEKQIYIQEVKKDKSQLHQSVMTYKKPILKFITKSYIVRVDQLENEEYRYSSWKRNKNTDEEPDLILYNGVIPPYVSSSGGHSYEFKSGNFKYICAIGFISDSYLIVEKDGEEILTQKVLTEFK